MTKPRKVSAWEGSVHLYETGIDQHMLHSEARASSSLEKFCTSGGIPKLNLALTVLF